VITKSKQAHLPHKTQLFGNLKAGYFLLHFLELQIPMAFGALICYLVVRLITRSSTFSTIYYPGTYWFAIGDLVFLTVPVVIWMLFRQYGWRYSIEIAVVMIAPVTAIMVFGQFTEYDYLTWLLTAGYPVMCLGMLVAMLNRSTQFTGSPQVLDNRKG
jgi:hypothetical protein